VFTEQINDDDDDDDDVFTYIFKLYIIFLFYVRVDAAAFLALTYVCCKGSDITCH